MKDLSTKNVKPIWDKIHVTGHAIDQYQSRVIEENTYARIENIIKKIKNAIINGRRSDRDPSLLMELEPWLFLVKWQHRGRPVTIWMDERRLCCLVVKDQDDPERLVVLTCFKAVHKEVKI